MAIPLRTSKINEMKLGTITNKYSAIVARKVFSIAAGHGAIKLKK